MKITTFVIILLLAVTIILLAIIGDQRQTAQRMTYLEIKVLLLKGEIETYQDILEHTEITTYKLCEEVFGSSAEYEY